MAGGRLHGLDGLRGIAALAVLGFHVLQREGVNAFLAVDFFFMLSGYVMARTYEPRFGVPGSAGRFMASRLLRLWPTIFVASLIGLPWLWWHLPADKAPLVAAANLFLLPTPTRDSLYVLNPPAWSILFELIANGLHGTVLYRLRGSRLGVLVAVLAALSALFAGMGGLHGAAPFDLLARSGVRLLCPYVLGIALYRVWRDVPPVRIPVVITWGGMPAYFVLGSWAWGVSWLPDLMFVLLLCPLLIAGGLQSGHEARLARFAGEVSFPLYAIHGPMLMIMRDLGVPLPVQFLACIAGGIALAMLMRAGTTCARAVCSRQGSAAQPAAPV